MNEFNEPWRNESSKQGADIRTADNEAILWTSDDGSFVLIDPKYVERIVACVNVCSGIPTKDLVRFASSGWTMSLRCGDTETETNSVNHQNRQDGIQPNKYCSPRMLIVDETSDGQMAWGELGNDGVIGDTSLTGRVLDPISREIRSGKNRGSVIVDGVEYAFTFNADQPAATSAG